MGYGRISHKMRIILLYAHMRDFFMYPILLYLISIWEVLGNLPNLCPTFLREIEYTYRGDVGQSTKGRSIMLLKAFYDALKGDTTFCQVAADFVQDHISTAPEKEKYVEWLRANPSFTCFIEAIAKFGYPEERHLIRKVVKHAILLSYKDGIGGKQTRLGIMRTPILNKEMGSYLLKALERFVVM